MTETQRHDNMNNKAPPGIVPLGMNKPVGMKPVAMRPASMRTGGSGGAPMMPGSSKPPEQYKEYKLRVPK